MFFECSIIHNLKQLFIFIKPYEFITGYYILLDVNKFGVKQKKYL